MTSTTATRHGNRLIEALPPAERDRLAADLDAVSVALRHNVAEPGQSFSHVYFPLKAVMSLVIEMQDGDAVEVATVGNEGMVGLPLVLDTAESPTRVFCQVAGDALRMRAGAFVSRLEELPHFNRLMHRYAQALVNQISQTTACNHSHAIEQRLARWLLMTRDRAGEDQFTLTQEFLAQMLGVRRPSVTIVAGMLQQAGLIRYSRGRITIVDRKGLEAGACECYGIVKEEHDRLIGGAAR